MLTDNGLSCIGSLDMLGHGLAMRFLALAL